VRSAEDDFIEFAGASSLRLRRTAYLLCGDWHTAEDLTQATLAKVFVAWRRLREPQAAHAYATRTLLNTYLADKRRKRPRELLAYPLPDPVVQAPQPEIRMAVVAALAELPPKARAVVVLRYWADQSIEQVAATLGCSPGNVKSQSARALARLRELLENADRAADEDNRPVTATAPRTRTGDQTRG
jgi:RNA polymerase sigma-70 factor (sigma-E family)